MLLAMDGLLKQAQLERRAIGSFNVYNGETIRGAVQAAGKTKLPMIISFGAGTFAIWIWRKWFIWCIA